MSTTDWRGSRNPARTQINVRLDNSLIERVTAFRATSGIDQTNAIAFLIDHALQSLAAIRNAPEGGVY